MCVFVCVYVLCVCVCVCVCVRARVCYLQNANAGAVHLRMASCTRTRARTCVAREAPCTRAALPSARQEWSTTHERHGFLLALQVAGYGLEERRWESDGQTTDYLLRYAQTAEASEQHAAHAEPEQC